MKVKVKIADLMEYSRVVCFDVTCKWNSSRLQDGCHCALKQVEIGRDCKCKLRQPIGSMANDGGNKKPE